VKRARFRVAAAGVGVAVIGAVLAWNASPVAPGRAGAPARAAAVGGPLGRSRATRRISEAKAVAPVHLRRVCGERGSPPRHYASIVVFAFENRTWNEVGTGFGRRMAYLHALGRQCSYFTDWRNADPRPDAVTEPVGHDSVVQYIAQVTGTSRPTTFDNCYPSASCSTKENNLFRQARRAGLSAVNYVEGAPAGCSSANNTATHVPALYLRGVTDSFYCDSQVRPLRDFNPGAPPAFAFITPSLCDDGHDCGDSVVDRWARAHIQPVLQSRRYAEGKVAVFVWYDEDRPAPNMWIAPTARSGARHLVGAGYAGTLRAWESMLGLPCLAHACTAPDMRGAANT
jgi:hypothetical protein